MLCCAGSWIRFEKNKMRGGGAKKCLSGRIGTLEKEPRRDGENRRDGVGCRWMYERKR